MKNVAYVFILLALSTSCDSGGETTKVSKDSLALVQDSLKGNPANSEMWLRLYELQINRSDSNGAINSLNKYLELVPQDENAGLEFAWLLAYKKDSNAVNVTNWLTQSKDPNVAVKATYIQAHYFGNIGETNKAINLLDTVIQANYQFTDAYIQKGIIRFEQAQYTEALDAFLMGLKVEPSNKELYYWIGETHKALGHTAEAADWQKKYDALQ